MKIKMYEAAAFRAFQNEIKSNKFSIKTSYKLARLSDKILKELEFYDQKMYELISEYAQKNEDGTPKFSDNGQEVLLQPEKLRECQEKIQELENLEIEVPDIKFEIEEFDGLTLSMDTLRPLMLFIQSE